MAAITQEINLITSEISLKVMAYRKIKSEDGRFEGTFEAPGKMCYRVTVVFCYKVTLKVE